MIPIIEISKRRSQLKQVPPGFPIQRKYDINNNYGTVKHSIRETNRTPDTNRKPKEQYQENIVPGMMDIPTIAKYLNTDYNESTNRIKKLPIHTSHMMSVVQVARKRAINHPVPPGFKELPILDTNNNAGRNGYNDNTEGHYLPNTQNNSTGKDNPLKSCLKFVKSEIFLTSEEIRSLKPECLRGTQDDKRITNEAAAIKKKKTIGKSYTVWKCKLGKIKKYIRPEKIKGGLKIGKTRKGPVFVKADVRTDVIGGEEYIVNVLTFDPQETEDMQALEVRNYTPDNFYETSEYFEIVSDVRKHVTRLIYTLGDMLLANEIEGRKEEWREYTDKMYEEERLWKKRCRDDDVIFEKTIRRSGENDVSWRSQIVQYAKQTITGAKNLLFTVCPCFFSKRERLKNKK